MVWMRGKSNRTISPFFTSLSWCPGIEGAHPDGAGAQELQATVPALKTSLPPPPTLRPGKIVETQKNFPWAVSAADSRYNIAKLTR